MNAAPPAPAEPSTAALSAPLQPRGLDSRLWRINAWLLLVAALAVLAAVATLFAAAAFDRLSARRSVDGPLATIDDGQSGVRRDETLTLGRFSQVPDGIGSHVWAPLDSDESLSDGYIGSKSGGAVRNYLFYNTLTGQSRWLLRNHAAVILEATEWPERRYDPDPDPTDPPQPPMQFRLFEIIDRDSNSDGRLSYRDQRLIAVSRPDGTGFVRLVAQVDQTHGARLSEDGERLDLFYRKGRIVRLARLDVASMKITSDVEVPLALPTTSADTPSAPRTP
jgi:hypothetical protein